MKRILDRVYNRMYIAVLAARLSSMQLDVQSTKLKFTAKKIQKCMSFITFICQCQACNFQIAFSQECTPIYILLAFRQYIHRPILGRLFWFFSWPNLHGQLAPFLKVYSDASCYLSHLHYVLVYKLWETQKRTNALSIRKK